MRFRPKMEQLETRETPAFLLGKVAAVPAALDHILPPPPDDGTVPITAPPAPPAPPPPGPTPTPPPPTNIP
jgi:hypothetical protein